MKKRIPILALSPLAAAFPSCFVADPFTWGTTETRSFVGKQMESNVEYELTYDFLGVDVATPRVRGREAWNSRDKIEVLAKGTRFHVLSSAKRLLPSGQYWLLLCKYGANRRFYMDVRDVQEYAEIREVAPSGISDHVSPR